MEFDPDAIIEGGEVENKSAPQTPSDSVGLIDQDDFTAFSAQDVYPKDGTYTFTVFSESLNKATTLISHTTKAGISSAKVCKVSLYDQDMIRLATGNHSAMCEIFLEAKIETNENIKDNVFSFVLDHDILHRISTAFTDEITFEVEAAKKLMRITSGHTQIEVSLLDETHFPDYHRRFSKPKHLGQWNPRLMASAMNYNLMFCQGGSPIQSMNQVAIRDKTIISGVKEVLGVSEHPSFEGISASMSASSAPLTARVFGLLDEDQCHAYDLGNGYLLIRDHTIFFVIYQYELEYPDISEILKYPTGEHLRVERSKLYNSLTRLSVVNKSPDAKVLMQFKSDGNIEISVKDESGKRSRDVVSFQGDTGEVTVLLSIKRLMQVLSHFKSASLVFCFSKVDGDQADSVNRKMYVLSEDAEGMKTTTVIISSSLKDIQALDEAQRVVEGK